MVRAWLVDDEELAIKRLSRMLAETGRVQVIGTSTDPNDALERLGSAHEIDALFLDVEMPGMNGFELLARLDPKPLVIFTTAYDQYAVKAFEANGTDYLLKPVTPGALDRAVARVEKSRNAEAPDYRALLERLASTVQQGRAYPRRLPSKSGDRVQFVDLDKVTHFFAEGKLTYAVTSSKKFIIDESIVQLEGKLDPAQFHRTHRAYLVSLGAVQEVCSWFGGRMVARLNDADHTEIPIARDRVKSLKERLGF